jgi:puromycin-sensitive aminopeptidase
MSVAEQPSYRLPRTVVPERYQLELAPDLDTARFSGTVVITARAQQEVDQIVLNAAEMEVSRAVVRPGAPAGARGAAGAQKAGARRAAGAKGAATTTEPPAATETAVVMDHDNERISLELPHPLPAGELTIELDFSGALNDKLRGFYLSSWTDESGTEQLLASTQFEPTDARRAFPCWDEPDLKATFAVTLVVDEALTAISNGAVVSEEPTGDGRRRVRFAETMPMSTYLVACVVGPFQLTEPVDVDGTPLRVATMPGKQPLTGFALDVGAHALRFLAGYFGLAYPHDKLDHVAIPDFAMGAMENLGCVTYRETALLVDPAAASQLEQRRVAQVVCHETAHMWFGDLVTMRWWNGIWLNEAFASFMETMATDAFRPEWELWTAFGSDRAAALAIDGLHATRPVEYPVGPPAEAEAMFDVLTYDKGCAVLRMLEQYVSPKVFQAGINGYLNKHRHANTETTDLWDAIESASGEPVRTIMDSWIFQGGHPVVVAEVSSDGRGLVLRQERFLYNRSGESGSPHNSERWAVPINLRASVGGQVRRTRALLEGDETVVDLGGPVDWALVNDGGWGFYRVQYDERLAAALPGLIGDMTPLERMALAGDTWALVVAGAGELSTWAQLVEGLRDDDDPDVWLALLAPLGLLDLVAAEKDRRVVRAFIRRIVSPALERVGWDPRPGDGPRTGVLRSRLIGTLGGIGADPKVRAEANRRLRRYWEDPASLNPDLITSVVNVVAGSGGEDTYGLLRERLRMAVTPQDQIRYLFALGEPEDPVLLKRTLDATLTSEIRTQDAPLLIGRIFSSRAGAPVALEWLEEHWDDAVGRFPNTTHARMLEGLPSLVDPELAETARRFVDAHPVPNAEASVAQLVERMGINVAFGERTRPGLAATLSAAD